MMRLLLCLLFPLVGSQTIPYVSFMGETLPNHAYVNLSLVGDPEEGGYSVVCHTNLQTCCSDAQNGLCRGDWYFPNGDSLGFTSGDGDIYQLRGAQMVNLLRRNNVNSPSGIYRCEIATNAVNDADDSSVRESVYVGVYGHGEGDVIISGDVSLIVDSDLNGDSPQFTLTCISTGGPATTITWTRDSVPVTEGTEAVTNSVTAEYTHTLIVTGRLGGHYTCTVANNKPSNDSKQILLQVASVPTNLLAVQKYATSILLSWSPSSDSTGYIISYSGINGSGTFTINDASTDNYLLTGLQNGVTYTIYIIARSQHFFSLNATVGIVHLVPGQPNASIEIVTKSSVSLTWSILSGAYVTSYEITWVSDDMEDAGNAIITNGSIDYVIQDLREGTDYIITISAVNPAGTSSSDAVTAVTGDVSVDAMTATSISLSWTNGGSLVGSYEVIWISRVCPDDEEEGRALVSSIDDGFGNENANRVYTIMALREGNDYTITVRGSITTISSPVMIMQTYSRTQETVPSAAPTSVGALVMNSTAINVQWGPVDCIHRNGYITGYSLLYAGRGSIHALSVSEDSNGGMTTISELSVATVYTVEVAAETSVGVGVYSDPLMISTLKNVYLSLNDDIIPNHGYVVMSDIGSTDNTALICHTNRPATLRNYAGDHTSGGEWFAPDQTVVFSTDVPGLRKNRGPGMLRLFRVTGTPTEGIYNCIIEDATYTEQTIFVGIYNSGQGDILIYDVVSLMVDSDLRGANPQFTLTCISTGGPATTVTWTRDSVPITEETETVLDDRVTAQYTHTLTVTGRLGGLYTCIVANDKPSKNSAHFTVEVASSPSNLHSIQISATIILVSWSPPSDATGYIISYTGGSSGNVNVSGGTTDRYLVTGLHIGAEYTISIVATSQHLSSDPVVTSASLKKLSVSVVLSSTTTLKVSWTLLDANLDTATSYIISYSNADIDCFNMTYDNITTRKTIYELTNLEEGTEYSITVTAILGDSGATEGTLTVGTVAAAPSAAPTSVNILEITPSNIAVQWGMVPCIERNGDVTGYSVQYSGGGDTHTLFISGGGATFATLSNLRSSAAYTIKVAPVNSAGVGQYSNSLHTLTAVEVPYISVDFTTATSISFSWTTAGSEGVSYEVMWISDECPDHKDEGSVCITGDGSGANVPISGSGSGSGEFAVNVSYTIIGLREGTGYTITISSFNAVSSVTNSINSRTQETVPSAAPTSVNVYVVNSTAISVQWGEVNCTDRNGVITSYLLQYIRSGNPDIMNVTGDSNGMIVTISELSAATMYTVKVAGETSAGIGVYSDGLHIDTPENVYLRLNDDIVPNRGYVLISDIGFTEDMALICHTNRPAPFRGRPHSGGEWIAPDQTTVFSTDVPGFRKNRDPGILRLFRVIGTPAEGIYHCELEDDTFTKKTVFVGLYNNGGGDIIISDVISLTVDSNLNGASPQFTLTCISTGGPATIVTWTRDSEAVIGYHKSVLVSGEAARFNHTLSVSGRLGGLYTCSLKNRKPSNNSVHFDVQVASAPSNLFAIQKSATSILVSWSPSSDATGYIISYTGGSNGSVTVGGGTTDSYLVTGFLNRASYRISIIATSQHLPSDNVIMNVSLVGLSVTVVPTSITSLDISWTLLDDNIKTATSYIISYSNTDTDCFNMTYNDITTSETTYELTNLEEGTEYSITVTALLGGGGATEGSHTDSTLDAVPSTPPAALSVFEVTSSSITVQWEMVPCIEHSGKITGYSVQYNGDGSTQNISVSKSDTTMVTIPNLESSAAYSIQIAAVNSAGTGLYSDALHTPTAVSVPVMSVESTTSTSISLSWTSAGSEAVSYEVIWTSDNCPDNEENGSNYITEDESGSREDVAIVSYTIIGLREGTSYRITITSSNAVSSVSNSIDSRTQETAPAAAPTSVSVYIVNSTAITVLWGEVDCIHRNGDITGYSVRYTGGGRTQTMIMSGDSSGGMVTISGLSAATEYLVDIAAVTSVGTGLYSDPLMIYTPENVYLRLKDNIIPNHGYVLISDIGSTENTALICHTNRPAPFRGRPHSGGEWIAPDQTVVFSTDVPGFGKNRDPGILRLFRVTGTPAEGIYRCVIEDDKFTLQTVFVGLYNSGEGDIIISGNMILSVDSDLNEASAQFTLTCISIGGPATTVTWTRDSEAVIGYQKSVFVNGVTSLFNHSLTVTERLGGLYTCNVANKKPSNDSANFTMQVASAPTELKAVQKSSTSILVSWHPSTDATGYIISYTGARSSGSVTVSDGSTDNYLVSGLQKGDTYTISNIATSRHFFSVNMTVVISLVTLSVSLESLSPNSLKVSPTLMDGVIVNYNISYINTDTYCFTDSDDITGITEGSYELTGLEEGTEYSIIVNATLSNGGTTEDSIIATTVTAVPSAAPTSVSLTAVNHSAINVQWGAVDCIHRNGDITGYSVQYTGGGSRELTLSVTGDSTKMATLTGLVPLIFYAIEVAAVNSAGTGVYSDHMILLTEAAYPVEKFKGALSSGTSFNFSWSPPSIAAELTTGYSLKCAPLLAGIPALQALTIAPANTTAVVYGLKPGVTYDCSITTITDAGSSEPQTLTLTTPEIAPSGAPEIFEVATGQRQVIFSWSPPPVTQRNGIITNYTISCFPSVASLPQTPSQSGQLTVAGFSPDTSYSCSVMATNSQGSGPLTNVTFTTQQDYVFFQLRLSGLLSTCTDVVSSERDEKFVDIQNAVLEQILASCSECSDITIDRQSFACYPESPTYVTYRARLEGTSEMESGSLISLIEEWVRAGVSIIVNGVLMKVDSKCSVAISSLSEGECSPSTPTQQPSTNPTDPPSNNTTAIIGGVVATTVIVLIIAIIAAGIVIIALRKHRGELSPKKFELPELPSSAVAEGVAINTSDNSAYKMTKQGRGQQEEKRHELSPSNSLTRESALDNVKEMYEIPLYCPSHNPCPATLSPMVSEGDADEEEERVYETIPGLRD